MPLDYATLEQAGFRNRTSRILNNCWEINRDLRDELRSWVENEGITGGPEDVVGIKRFTVTDREQQSRHQKHFAVVVDSDIVANSLATTGHVIVDAALDQFNDVNFRRGEVPFSLGGENTLAGVVIAPPGDEFRMNVYHDKLSVSSAKDISATLPN